MWALTVKFTELLTQKLWLGHVTPEQAGLPGPKS
jgi:hypothetical protein